MGIITAATAEPERSSSERRSAALAEWIDVLSGEHYRPMLRLLNEDDWRFLRGQPGFTPEMIANLRTQRRRLFLGYLRRLDSDFQRVCLALEITRSRSPENRSSLAWVLLRSQCTFACGLVLLRLRLWLHAQGVGSVNVAGLVKLFNELRQKLCAAAAAAELAPFTQ